MEETKKSNGINNQELNNILLEDAEEEPVSNSKKALMIGAALVVVFFVAIGVIRTLNSGDDKSNSNVILPPEPAKKVDENPVFEKVPVKDGTQMDEKFDKIIKEIKEKTEPDNQQQPANNNGFTDVGGAKDNQGVGNTPAFDMPKVDEKPKGFVKNDNRGFAVEQPTQQEEPVKKQQAQPKPQRSEEPVAKHSSSGGNGSSGTVNDDNIREGHYIQVGAFYSLEPSQGLLTDIKNEGFKYIIFKTKVNSKDITKVIIGPFNKDDAKDKLEVVRDKINKSAYILKVK